MNHTIQNGFLTVTAAGEGAQLQSILASDGTEFLWQGNPTYWTDRALNLFPYVARLTEGSYFLDGVRYQMDIHGIAPYRSFSLVYKTQTEMTFALDSDAQTLAAYPRAFSFRVSYALEGSTLAVTFEVENRDSRTLYFGLGGHPGFNVPLEPGKAFTDYRLRFSEPTQPLRVGFTADCFLSGEDTPFPLEQDTILPLSHSLFDQDAIVLKNVAHTVTLESVSGGHAVTVSYPMMDNVGFWHMPRTDAPYVCIEPWASLPSRQGRIAVFEEQEDLISLAPGGTYQNRWTIQVHTP